MKQEYLYIVFIAAIIGYMIYRVATRQKRLKDRFLGQIVSSWGQLPKREYDFGELDKISRYFKSTTEEGTPVIDDITWSDLDMDDIYSMINNCRSCVGDDYLYKMLRTPLTSKKDLEERRRIINFFRENETIRMKYQLELSRIGRSKRFAVIDYVKTLQNLIPDSNIGHYLQLSLYAASILLIIAQPAMGILFLLGVLVFNIYTYYKTKSEIEPYFVTVQAIVHLIDCAQEVSKLDVRALSEYTARMQASIKTLGSVKRNSKFLGTAGAVGGDMGSAMGDYFNMFFRLDLIMFNRVVNKLQTNKEDILVLMEELGRLDACISAASFQEMLPFCCEADLTEGSMTLSGQDMYHPLLSEPVANTIRTERPVLLTGSNASGKSTFLKTVAISQLLSQTLGIALAKSFTSGFYRIYSSMALKDSIQEHESYFMVEIKSLKRIMDAAAEKTGTPVMCFIDEVLRGTNTVERIAASSRILEHFSLAGVFCFAATHDIELTHMLENLYANYHFTEDVQDGDVIFSYRLFEGRATTRNAIKLLGILGYDEDVIRQADDTAARFLQEGVWSLS